MGEIDDRIKQENNKQASRRVYSTELINKLIQERQQGFDIPFDAFFMRQLDLRAPNITFRMTDEEMAEYQHCYDDPEYFIEQYCKFMTDKGLHTVDLRDYQRKIIDAVTEEKYSEKLEDFIPANRSVIILASRQIGKCVTADTQVVTQETTDLSGEHKINKKILDIYYKDSKLTFLEKLKICLYKIYTKL